MAELTPEACRAARAILRWSVRELAQHAGIAFSTVHLFEKGDTVREESKAKMVAAFAAKHVEITNGDGTGARLRKRGQNDEGLRPDQLNAANDE